MANPWDQDEIVVDEVISAPVSAMPWDQDEIIQSDGIRTGDDGGLEIDIVGGRLQHDDGRLTEEGWNREADLLKYQREADELSGGASEFLAGLYASGIDTAQGAYQFAIDSMARPAMLAATAGGDSIIGDVGRRVADPLVSESQRIRQDVAQRRREEEGFSNSLSGGAGRVVGNIAQFVGPGALSRGTVAAGALMPTTITGNALQGAAIGAVQPVVSEGERGGNIALGGILGGVVPAGIKLASGVGSAASNLASRTGVTNTDRRAAEIIRREAANPDAVVFQDSMVPGVQRTVGESTQDQGLMALEDRVRSSNRAMFGDLDIRNNAARVAQLQRIAGSDSDMAAAIAARDDVVDTSLSRALGEGESSEVARLARADADSKVANDAVAAANAENARLSGLNLTGRVPVPELPASSGVSDELSALRSSINLMKKEHASRPSVQLAINDVSRSLRRADDSVSSLYGARKYINDLLDGKAGGEKSYAKAATRELMQIRGQLDDLISSRAPSFPEYLDAYKAASKPINRMDVGREIIDRSSGAVPDILGNRTITPAAFSRVTNDLDYLAQQATGFKKAKASDIMISEDISMLGAIQDDMTKQAARLKSAAGNSSTDERKTVGARLAERSLGSRLPFVGSYFEHFEQMATERLTERLAYLMANPSEAKRVLSALPKKEASVVRNAMAQLSMAAGRTSPATLDNE